MISGIMQRACGWVRSITSAVLELNLERMGSGCSKGKKSRASHYALLDLDY